MRRLEKKMNQKKHRDNKESLLTSAGMEMKVGGSDIEGQEGATEEGVNEEKQTEPKKEEKQDIAGIMGQTDGDKMKITGGVGKDAKSEEEEEEITFTKIASTRDKEPTAMKGRVTVSMALGSGAKRREHLRIINNCKNIDELNSRTALMRIWRVEITHD